jgi:hypothetical protein
MVSSEPIRKRRLAFEALDPAAIGNDGCHVTVTLTL